MPKITEMYAFIAAMKLRGDWLPLVGADMARVESLKPIAEDIARATGQKITLAKFSTRTRHRDNSVTAKDSISFYAPGHNGYH